MVRTSGQWTAALDHLRRAFRGEGVSGLGEGELLDRFIDNRDEFAFGAIVDRHASTVLGACRGLLDDPRDVEDAFQATFLVLARRAGTLRDRDRLAPWLHGVARKVALRARSRSLRRKSRERPDEGFDPPATDVVDASHAEIQRLVREEVERLSDNDRLPVVLCYLEGLTHEEAADRLGWPIGTVKGRLARARDKLKGRLARRGLAPSAEILLPWAARVAVPADLARSTTLAALQIVSGKPLVAGIVPVQALALAEGVLFAMFSAKLKIGAAAALLAAGTLAVPAVVARPQDPKAEVKESKTVTEQKTAQPSPAPVARSGGPEANTQAVLLKQAESAVRSLQETMKRDGPIRLDAYGTWSKRLMEAQSASGLAKDRIAAIRAHLDRMKDFKKWVDNGHGDPSMPGLENYEVDYLVAEAEKWLAQGQADPLAAARPADARASITIGVTPSDPNREPRGGGGFGGMGGIGVGVGAMGGSGGPGSVSMGLPARHTTPEDEKRNKAILAKLDEPVSMNFGTDTSFGDFLQYVEQATQDEKAGFPNGLPFYVDPAGFKRADVKPATSKISNLRLENIPLRTTLRLALEQLDLIYKVEDGLVIITNNPNIQRKGPR